MHDDALRLDAMAVHIVIMRGGTFRCLGKVALPQTLHFFVETNLLPEHFFVETNPQTCPLMLTQQQQQRHRFEMTTTPHHLFATLAKSTTQQHHLFVMLAKSTTQTRHHHFEMPPTQRRRLVCRRILSRSPSRNIYHSFYLGTGDDGSDKSSLSRGCRCMFPCSAMWHQAQR
jgi:hypothetical protein